LARAANPHVEHLAAGHRDIRDDLGPIPAADRCSVGDGALAPLSAVRDDVKGGDADRNLERLRHTGVVKGPRAVG
jgi:hypothetical protein